jgi:hypothetical protein
MAMLYFVQSIAPHLPSWLTVSGPQGDKPGSILDCLVIAGMLGFHMIERKWLFVRDERGLSRGRDPGEP